MTDVFISDACDEGEHTLEWDETTFVCAECEVSSQTLSDYLGHSLTPYMGDSDPEDTDSVNTNPRSEPGESDTHEDTPDQATLAGFGEVTA